MRRCHKRMSSWVTIMASKPCGTLYAAAAADLVWRTCEHREGQVEQMNPKWQDLWGRITL